MATEAPSQTSKTAENSGLPATHAKDGKTSKDYYFDSYSHFGIHEEMLKDTVRTRTYQKAITQNKHLFRGKTVLDIGCGTGILSLFAAKTGAKHVYGIDMADIAYKAQQIVKDNGFEGKITIIKGKVEEIELPVEKVDIIVSEWMGYFLLYESMLDSVLFARDKWLAKDGLLFPDKATMYMCGIEDADYKSQKIEFWNNVYGFNMSCIREDVMKEPLVDICNPNQVITETTPFFTIDLYTVQLKDLDFETAFKVSFSQQNYLHALVAFFDVEFTKCHTRTGFSTGPHSKYTHWKQTVFYLDEELAVEPNTTITCNIKVTRNTKNPRDIDIKLNSEYVSYGNKVKQERQYFMR